MSRLQRPNRTSPSKCNKGPHSVEAWGYRFGSYKLEHEDWSQYSEKMLARCIQDVEIQYKIYNSLREEGDGEGWANAHRLNNKLFHYLQLQEEYGWTLDNEHVDKSLALLNHWMRRIDDRLNDHLPIVVERLEKLDKEGNYSYVKKPFKKDGSYSQYTVRYWDDGDTLLAVHGPYSRVSCRRISLDSSIEVKQFLLNLGWIPDEWNKDKNGKRTSPKLSKDDQFNGISGSLGRLVTKYIQCKQRRSVLEGWQGNLDDRGKIKPKVGGIANTGRLKHSVIVNVPNPESGAFFAKYMRQCFVANPGS
jgi:hypothetical protein